MARVTYGIIITDIQGSIGGVTFQSNKAGKIARLRPATRKKPKSKQGGSIVDFSTLAVEWRSLSVANQILWNDFAAANPKINKYGTSKTLTGFNYFISLNYWVALLKPPILSAPPAYVLPAPLTAYTMVLSNTDIKLTAFTGPTGAALKYIVYATLPVTTISPSNFNKARYLGAIDSTTALPLDITALWEAAFSLKYSDIGASSTFNISFMIQVVNNSVGITSVGLFKTFSH